MTDPIEERLLADIITNPSLDGRTAARRTLERYYGRDSVPSQRPTKRYTLTDHSTWHREYRRDGTLKREGGSRTITHTFEGL